MVVAGCLAETPVDTQSIQTPQAPTLAEGVRVHLANGLAPVALPSLPAIASVWRDLGHDAVEPTLGVTSKGTIFYAAVNWATGATDVLRSRDGGITWEDVSPRLPTGHNVPPETGDPYVWVDPDTDRVFTFDMFPALACGVLSWSDDEGASWTTQPLACATPPPYDHQTLTTGKPRSVATRGYPNVVYQCVNRVSDSICARSLDGGLTWSPGTPVFLGVDPSLLPPSPERPLGAFCGGLHGHLVASPDGTLYLPREYCGRPFVGISTDDGATWTRVQVSDVAASSGPDPAVAVDEEGNVYYTWVHPGGLLYVAVSRDQGRTWSEPFVASPAEVTATHLPAIAAAAKGHVVIAYAGTETLPGGYDNEEFSKPASQRPADGAINSATWNGYLAVLTDALSSEPTIVTVTVNDPADPLVRGYCGPGRCPGMYDFIDVVIGPDGRPYAGFVDACVGECAGPEGTYQQSQGRAQGRAGALVALAQGPNLRAPGILDGWT